MSAIDHVQTANALTSSDWRAEHAVAQLAEAQVHATLALVEQQQETNRHLEAIADELRRNRRVVGL